jgi:hypothetical protein
MTACAARLEAAFAARDTGAIASLHCDRVEGIHHPTGTSYDREGALESFQFLLDCRDPTWRLEPLATLGDSLALFRRPSSGRAVAGLDAGAFELEEIVVMECDAQRRISRAENLAADHLGDAVVRLYQRYAELLPEGPERERAAASARLVASWNGELGPGATAAAMAPDVEVVDHRLLGTHSSRGVEPLLRSLRGWLELASEVSNHAEDVLALRADSLLARWSHRGVAREGGGSYERVYLLLWTLGADGLVTHWELFDPDREAEALVRFDQLVAEAAPRSQPTRRVRANAATAQLARFDAARAERNAGALPMLLSEDYQLVEHTTGASWGRSAQLHALARQFQDPHLASQRENLATLGDSLVVSRTRWTGRDGTGRTFDVGAWELDKVGLTEVDAQGRLWRTELFGQHQLGDAVVRLYQRYADLLPEGPERTRAAGAARAVAAIASQTHFSIDSYLTVVAPGAEFTDHRAMVGLPPARGASEWRQRIESWFGAVEDSVHSIEDVFDLGPAGLVHLLVERGHHRAGGGSFEVHLVQSCVFDAEGRLARLDLYDPDRAGEALARFDELTAPRPKPRVARRVRPNAATAHAARFDAAVIAQDVERLRAVLGDDPKGVDHITHTAWDGQAAISAWCSLLLAQDPVCRHQPLAALGDALALCHVSLAATALVRGKFDVGPYEQANLSLIEVDDRGRRRWAEVFAEDKLGDAVARLYERHAEIQPEGPERARAAAAARSVAAVFSLTPASIDRYAAVLAPESEFADHRALVRLPHARGASELRQRLESWFETVEDSVTSIEDVLDLRPHGIVFQISERGRDRAGGGSYEIHLVSSCFFDAEGRLARVELFDPDRAGETLARFDALAADPAPAPPRIENAATRAMETFTRSWDARDWEGVVGHWAPSPRVIDRRSLTGVDLGGGDVLDNLRVIYDQPGSRWQQDVLATRGERLALVRWRWLMSKSEAVLAEVEYLAVVEVDAAGRQTLSSTFDPGDLDAAYEELDRRYFAGEASGARATAAFRAVQEAALARDWDRLGSLFAPDFAVEDHRSLGTLHRLSRDEWVASVRSLFELRPDTAMRADHVLGFDDRRGLVVGGWIGSRAEGAFEIPSVVVAEVGPEGFRRWHAYDLAQLDAARACYDALAPGAPRDPLCIPPNAATRAWDRVEEAFEARDWPALRALAAPDFRFEDRGRRSLIGGGAETWIRNMQVVREWPALRTERRLLATAGDRLALERALNATDSGEVELLRVAEIAADGRLRSVVRFDPDDRRAAFRELAARHARSEALPAELLEVRRALLDGDLDRLRAVLPASFAVQDHRRNRLWKIEGPEAWTAWMATLYEQSPDVVISPLYYLASEGHGSLTMSFAAGTLPEGGEFEQVFVTLWHHPGGRCVGLEMFEPEDLERARARFEELRAAKRE